MAQNLTGLGKTVLLVEGDIRRRVFAEYLYIKKKRGLVSVLAGETTLGNAVVHEPSLRANILIGEKTTTNAADLFSSDRFKAFLDEVRKKHGYGDATVPIAHITVFDPQGGIPLLAGFHLRKPHERGICRAQLRPS